MPETRVTLRDQRREPDTHPTVTHLGDDGIHHLEEEPTSIFCRSAVAVSPLVYPVAQELIDQVAMGTVDLHGIEARPGRPSSGCPIVVDNPADLAAIQGTGYGCRVVPAVVAGSRIGGQRVGR